MIICEKAIWNAICTIPIKSKYYFTYNMHLTYIFRHCVAMLLLAVYIPNLSAQLLIPYRIGNKWGYCDSTKSIKVKCIYDETFFFEDEQAFVRVKNKFGLIQPNGSEVIPPKYNKLGYFHHGLAAVNEEGKYGFLDMSGAVKIPLKYEYVGNFEQNLARAKQKGKWGMLNKEGNKEVDFIYDDIRFIKTGLYMVKKEGKWGTMDSDGREGLATKYDTIGRLLGSFRLISQNKKWGLADSLGNVALACEYDEIDTYETNFMRLRQGEKYALMENHSWEILPCIYGIDEMSDLAESFPFYLWQKKHVAELTDFQKIGVVVKKNFAVKKGEKWGILDTLMTETYPFKLDSIATAHGCFLVKKGGKWGIIAGDGKTWVNYCRYTQIKEDKLGNFAVYLADKCGIIDTSGSTLVPCIYDEVSQINGTFFKIAIAGKYGIVNLEGEIVAPVKFQSIEDYGSEYALLQTADKSGLFHYASKTLQLPSMFEELTVWKNNLFIVKKEKKYGLINVKGDFLHPMVFDAITEYPNNMLMAVRNEKMGWIDSMGRMFIVCKYDSVGDWYGGYSPAKLKGKWGMIDSLGKTLIPFQYSALRTSLNQSVLKDEMAMNPFAKNDSGYVWVRNDENLWGITNRKGQEIIACKYDSLYPCNLNKNLFITKMAGRFGLVNKQNEELLAPAYADFYETSNGFFVARQGTRFALISASGEPITPFKYQEIQYIEAEKYIWVIYDDKKGLIDFTGKEYFEKGK